MARKKEPEKAPNHERWLITYSDLITLLMIFFIIMYSMSNVDAAKYKQVAQSLSVAMGSGGNNIVGKKGGVSIDQGTTPVDATLVEQNKMEEVKQKVDKAAKENGLTGSLNTTIEERGLVISLKDTVLFDTGKAEIRPETAQRLVTIGKILNSVNNYIRVEGHTDNVPISNYIYKSNWDLSVIRATNVTEMLISQAGLPPQKLSAVGYGEYRPIADNSTEVGKSKNRRVDIIVMNSKFNQVENNKKQ